MKQMGVHGKLLFLDSGAHGLYSRFVIDQGHKHGYDFYSTKEFYLYLDAYGAFCAAHPEITVYANVDAIFEPKISFEAQRYLENKYSIRPMPVIHYGTPLKWLKKYLRRDHEYIALGGLGQEVHRNQYIEWADSAFSVICGGKEKTPQAKVHGFAVTSFALMRRYPWYSVDSTSWLLHAVRGTALVPHRKNGQWTYTDQPLMFQVAPKKRNPDGHMRGEHVMKQLYHEHVAAYLSEFGFPLGKSTTSYDPLKNEMTEEVIEKGVCNDHYIRGSLNARYYLEFAKRLPQWPWPFFRRGSKAKRLGVMK